MNHEGGRTGSNNPQRFTEKYVSYKKNLSATRDPQRSARNVNDPQSSAEMT